MVITNSELYRYYENERILLDTICNCCDDYRHCDGFFGNRYIINTKNKYKLSALKLIINDSFNNIDEMCQFLSINNFYLPIDIKTSIQLSKNASIDKIKKHNIKDLLDKSEFYVKEYARDKDNHIMTPLEEFFVGVNDLLKDLLKKGNDEYERYKN